MGKTPREKTAELVPDRRARIEASTLIITKHRVYPLQPGHKGQPVEQAFPGAQLPRGLKGAKLYIMADGTRVIARPEPSLTDFARCLVNRLTRYIRTH